eukprot:1155891-Pelagomonas_calceolata.AAC.1
MHLYALSQPNSPPGCPNPPAAPPSLQVDPRMCPGCPGGYLLQAWGRLLFGEDSKFGEDTKKKKRIIVRAHASTAPS